MAVDYYNDQQELIHRLRKENDLFRTALSKDECGRKLIQQSDEFSLLLDVGKAIISELDLQKVFELVADRAQEIIQADTVVIPMISETRDHFTYMAATGEDSEDIVGVSFKINVGMCGWVLKNEQPLLFGESDEWWMEEKTNWEKGQQSALLVPLFGRRRIIGGLSGLGKVGGGSFTEHDLDLLTMFANQVSTAIENASLFQERQGMITELEQKIEERKEAALALRESEKKYRTLIETTNTGFVKVDGQGYVLDANKEYVRMTGRRQLSEIMGHNVIEWTAEYDQQRNADEVKKCFEQGYVRNLEIDYIAEDGSTTPVEINATLIEEKGQSIILTIMRDITERKEAEKELAAEKERLSVTLRSIGDGVITTDTSGKVVLINKIAEVLTGWNQHEAIGSPLEDVFNIINEQTREPCENPVKKVFESGKIIGLEHYTALLISRDGTERCITDSGAPIRDKESRIIGVVLVFRDVTEKIRMEEELLKVEKLESVGVLAGGIAHDFNNILMAILGNINLATQFVTTEDKAYPLLIEAEKASLRARDLTQQLLTFSKGGEPVKQTASIQEVIKDSADFVLRGGKVACQYHMPDALWLVEIDKGQMSQVIQNLIINANHAMPEGGIIHIACENISTAVNQDSFLPDQDNYVKITISDSGIGIPENIIDKIFDPYFSTKQEGSGLGLAIIHSIISKHDGHIYVRSEPGVGTTFTIHLPAAFNKQHIEKTETVEPVNSQINVMIMDDEEMIRNVGEKMLAHLGYEVVLAKDGAEAIELYKGLYGTSKAVEVVIMDLTIPGGMGGEEAVKEILAINPDAKVIVSSGYSNDPIMSNCQEYGFSSAVVKPYELQELIKGINMALL